MNENSYFKDIIDVFLKAKKAEDIDINPHFKAATREMLSYKIDQIKGTKDTQSFWNKWKKTIIGVPASLLAVFVVVFALQNNQITVEKDNFAPSNTEMGEAEILETIQESPVIEDAEQQEERKMKIETLVIDYSDTDSKDVAIPTQPVYQPTYVQTGGGPVTSDTPVIVDDPNPTKTVEPLPTPQPETYVEPEPTQQPQESQPTTAPVEYIDITDEPEPEPEVTTQETPILLEQVEEIPTRKVQEIIKDDILIDTDETINYFREPISSIEPDFDKTVLEKLEITDNLSTVNVHYLNEDQVAVEITTGNEIRWYIFEEMNGEWAMTQKFD